MSEAPIPFNRPHTVGKELTYIADALRRGKISGNGVYTQRCQEFLEQRYGFAKALLTASGTDALEMAAILSGVGPGDEVIMPSYTYVSTANAFLLRGATVVFADVEAGYPNLDVEAAAALITPRTRVVVPVHYGGAACRMDALLQLAERHGVMVVEDAAQAINAFYIDGEGRHHPLGRLGALGAFSFHETKNVISGEGGMLAVNAPSLISRAEIIWEKGTNRAAFWRGEANRYEWMDVGSSFLPSEITAAFLWAQLEALAEIHRRRMALWQRYYEALAPLERKGWLRRPRIPSHARHNGHIFYVLTEDEATRSRLIAHLQRRGIMAVFHYLSLHKSPFYRERHDGRPLPNAERYSATLLRLPLFHDLTAAQQDRVVAAIAEFFGG